MHHLPKYVVLLEDDLIFTGSRPGGVQGDHVTAYALFQEILRSHHIKNNPMATIVNFIHLINTLSFNFDIFLRQAKIQPEIEEEIGVRQSYRTPVLAGKKQVTKDEDAQRDVEVKTKEAESKYAGDVRDVVLRTEYQELKRLLDKANKALKSSSSMLKKAESRVPVVHPDENTITDILKRLDDLSNQLLLEEGIDEAISSVENEKVQESVKGDIVIARKYRYEQLILKLANSYLILRNKQPYTAFPRKEHPAPPKNEAEKVIRAIEIIRNIQTEIIAKKNISEKRLSKAAEAIWDLFWYPLIPGLNIVSAEGSSSDRTGKKRNNNLPDLVFVMTEHLETCFLAFPAFTSEQRIKIRNKFVRKVVETWNLSKHEGKQIDVLISPYEIDHASMVDSQASEPSSCSEDEKAIQDYKKLTHGHGEFSSDSEGSEYIPLDQEESEIPGSSPAAPSNDETSSEDERLKINTSTIVPTSSREFSQNSPKRTLDHTEQNLSVNEMRFRIKK